MGILHHERVWRFIEFDVGIQAYYGSLKCVVGILSLRILSNILTQYTVRLDQFLDPCYKKKWLSITAQINWYGIAVSIYPVYARNHHYHRIDGASWRMLTWKMHVLKICDNKRDWEPANTTNDRRMGREASHLRWRLLWSYNERVLRCESNLQSDRVSQRLKGRRRCPRLGHSRMLKFSTGSIRSWANHFYVCTNAYWKIL